MIVFNLQGVEQNLYYEVGPPYFLGTKDLYVNDLKTYPQTAGGTVKLFGVIKVASPFTHSARLH